MDNFTYMNLVDLLNYDIVRFQMYVAYVTGVDKEFLFFEKFLLKNGNLYRYNANPDEVKGEYVSLIGANSFDSLPDYFSFESFCNHYHLNMYDESIIDSKRACDNCIFAIECITNDTQEHFLGCTNNEDFDLAEVNPDYLCDFHVFDSLKAKLLIEDYRLERKRKHNN